MISHALHDCDFVLCLPLRPNDELSGTNRLQLGATINPVNSAMFRDGALLIDGDTIAAVG